MGIIRGHGCVRYILSVMSRGMCVENLSGRYV